MKARKKPSISLQDFAQRRRELMALMDPNSIAILPSARLLTRNGDVEYRFRQDSDFHYLTGFDEHNSVFVLIPGREHGEAILFCREREENLERWHGKVTGPERAMQLYGIDDAFPITDIDDIVPGLIEGKDKLYYAMGAHGEFDQQVIGWVNSIAANGRSGTQPPGEFVQLGQYLHELRLFKRKQEIAVMRQAAAITGDAHRRIMMLTEPGMYEYQLEAELEYSFMSNGARTPAYPTIVGGGSNACVLHYIQNDNVLRKGDLVLVDAGCEYESYAADVTRTFPVSGKFSKAQAELYSLVLAAQQAAIDQVQPGNNWNQPHEAALVVLTEGLIRLGLLQGEVDEALETGTYKKYCMHKTGHWLGLDVHDVGEYKVGGEWRVFEEGMITTIEPGLYIAEDCDDAPARYRGIGVRIEDNVLVTKTGNEVITATTPKTINEIESVMAPSIQQIDSQDSLE
jgi:Xaa-Pro aminopeptidase|tara:strand:+ start:5550 stop:6917 length:1368 start_codon:yes stop_codon:yes gene_type:complete